MTNQEKKNELKKYGNLNKDIDRKLSELERIKAMCTRMTTAFSDMPRTPGIKTREDLYIKLADLADEINADVDRYVDMRSSVVRIIKTVDDSQLQRLLMLRYVDEMNWDDVAEEMKYDVDGKNVYKLHGRALTLLKLDTELHL